MQPVTEFSGDCMTLTASLTQHLSTSSSPQPCRDKAVYRTQTAGLVPLYHNMLTALTCALVLCRVWIISLPTFGNTVSIQKEEWGFTKAALICLATPEAVLITP